MRRATAPVLALAFNCEIDATLPVGVLPPGDVYRVANGTLVAAEALGLDAGPAAVIACGIGEAERANGHEVVVLARDAVRTRNNARLRLLIDCFPFVVLRVAEVRGYLDDMREADAMRIAGLRKDQGPERGLAFQFACVRTLDAIKRARGGSIATAATALSKVVRPRQDARALRTLHSRLRPFLRLRTEGLYLAAADLMPADWTPKSQRSLNHNPSTEGDPS